MHEAYEVKYWTHQLGVTREQLQKAVDKVGNSAAAVRKQLAVSRDLRFDRDPIPLRALIINPAQPCTGAIGSWMCPRPRQF